MDPKSPLYNAKIGGGEATQVIMDWLAKGQSYAWGTEPGDVIAYLIQETDDGGYITFGAAIKILRDARTHKMPGNANRGMGWIEDQWKAIAKKSLTCD